MRLTKFMVLASLLASGAAWADDPKFTFAKQEEVKAVVWKATLSAGLVLNTGNANNLAFNAAGFASRNDGKNRLQLDVGGTYARATLVSAADGDGDGFISPSEVQHDTSTTAALWGAKLRYDRFLTPNNSLYVAAFATGNKPAGINVATGGQIGYSRQLYKSDMHLIAAEAGYDFTYQNNVAPPNLNIHSLRLFAGYTLTLSKDVGIAASVEVLSNLNPLPPYVGTEDVGPFKNTRVNGTAALNARLWKNIALQLSFLARYTTNPSLLPAFSVPFAAGYTPRAEPLDTVTSLSLVVTLL